MKEGRKRVRDCGRMVIKTCLQSGHEGGRREGSYSDSVDIFQLFDRKI